MTELWPRRSCNAAAGEQLQPRIEGDLAQYDDHVHARKKGDLGVEMIETACDLTGRRFVARRGAAYGRRDVRILQPQPIGRVMRRRDVREARPVERRHQEIAGSTDTITGKDAARAVRSVRRRRETDEQQTRRRISKARHRTSPVLLVAIGPAFLSGDTAAVLAKARASFA
jgi:hypothetical protein